MTTTSTAEQAQQELLEEFELFDNWMDRYQYIIDMGKALPAFPDEHKRDELKIQGCQSNVWMHHERQGDTLHFAAISDAAIVSGLIAVLMRIYNDRKPSDILATSPHFLKDLGLDKHLSPTRSNGLNAMLERIYRVAEQEAA
ncbi:MULTISPECIES: SufE family protein [Halomonas]|jgi:cysteine desulfuration protein SufE|uniref:SufE family protein n=2 Tax=Halomonas TaxID=2745 RepID=A0AAU7KZL0_9GAMM|nr:MULTISPECIES: SufE family protein [Halomonas]MBR9773149.1 SufE family protein [Gammaproteobacteria bacterium]KJZ16844.1 Fe-S cluster assembly protein SufE [Halomonas sp. S2151]MAR71404.1 Fe-S cluster assembly protein SufE [Halomonas sp.]MBR9881806.1 SufE family protein [Gammaproteobacteria bacterium]MBS8268069.1 SufE family protein [Halomonas litopenaei]|tara:strand:+ start:1839 stop:2264 length:426 start_codon:yes stop_codon:yes gene_type:complete